MIVLSICEIATSDGLYMIGRRVNGCCRYCVRDLRWHSGGAKGITTRLAANAAPFF
jgi:hypothetical protein